MFKTIVESVLNEITASLAYEKYYNKIPSDQFFNLVQYYFGKEGDTGDFDRENLKFDKMLTFIFNAILKGDRVYDAKKFIDKYKNAKNEVRIAFLNEFRSGKFEDITDMIYRLEELEKNGVTTLSSFYKNGLIVFYKDEEWTVTCTTTYSANHHYFGHTKWCTASDRLGNYDGWLFFQRYIFDVIISEIRFSHFCWKRKSPTDSISSTMSMSGCVIVAIEKPSRATIPEE